VLRLEHEFWSTPAWIARAGAELGLSAGGSLARVEAARLPHLSRRVRLLLELAVLYIGAPLAIAWVVHSQHVPLFVALTPVLVLFIAYLLWDDGFLLRRELTIPIRWRILFWIVAIFAVAGGAMALAAREWMPGAFLAFPKYRPELWMFVMVAYPVLSVVPQELAYRTFFFHRYGPLFGDARWLAITVNGLLFGFAHVIFENWIAVIGTGILGILLAYRYETTRSFWAVWLEHTLYGCLIFTIGFGRYFFTGVSSL